MTWKLHVGDTVYPFDDPNAADITAEQLDSEDLGVKIWVEEPKELMEIEAAKAEADMAAFEAWLFEQEEDVK